MLAIRYLDRARYTEYKRRHQTTVPPHVRTLFQYFRWKVVSVKKQSKIVWLIIAQCAVLYGGFYTVLSYSMCVALHAVSTSTRRECT